MDLLTFHARVLLLPVFFVILLMTCSTPAPVVAAEQTIITEGEYRMGDRDTREDAIRLATETAKRHVLEQVATYVESVTIATALDMTKDEIRIYTAGVVRVIDQQVSTRVEDEVVVIHVDLIAEVDPDDVTQAVLALRHNEDARQQVQLLRSEMDELHRQLDEANTKLAEATSPEQVQFATQQRQDTLKRMQSNDLLEQAWVDWALVGSTAYPMPWIGINQAQALWGQAWALYPANPHLVVLQRVLPVQVPVIRPAPATAPAVASRIRPVIPRHAPAIPRAFPSPPLTRLAPTFRLPPRMYHVPSAPPSSFSRRPFGAPHSAAPQFSPRSSPRSYGGGHRGGRR